MKFLRIKRFSYEVGPSEFILFFKYEVFGLKLFLLRYYSEKKSFE